MNGLSAEHVRLLLEKVESAGISGRSILKACGLSYSVAQIGAPGGVRLARRDVACLREACIRRIRHRFAERELRNMSRRDFEFMCHSLITALTLGEAIERLCHFFELTSGHVCRSRLAIDSDGHAGFEVILGPLEKGWSTFFIINAFLLLSQLFGWMIGDDLGAEYEMRSIGSEEDRMLAAVFEIDVGFGADADRMRFSAYLLDRAIVRDGSDLREFLATFPFHSVHPQEVTSGIGTQIESLYRSAIAAAAPLPRAAEIGRILGMSPATLRRALAHEKRSLRRIKEDVRNVVACSYLAAGRTPVSEISRRLGFSGQKSFERAFTGWNRLTPSAFRRRAGCMDLTDTVPRST